MIAAFLWGPFGGDEMHEELFTKAAGAELAAV